MGQIYSVPIFLGGKQMTKGTDLRQDGVKIQLDKERTLLFDLNTLVDMEDEYGDVDLAMKELSSGKMSSIRKMVFFALRHEDENLTERQAASLIPMNKIGELSEKLTQALQVSLPEENKNEKNE